MCIKINTSSCGHYASSIHTCPQYQRCQRQIASNLRILPEQIWRDLNLCQACLWSMGIFWPPRSQIVRSIPSVPITGASNQGDTSQSAQLLAAQEAEFRYWMMLVENSRSTVDNSPAWARERLRRHFEQGKHQTNDDNGKKEMNGCDQSLTDEGDQ